MSEGQVAGVYARALFDAARAAGRIDEVRRELGDFVAALAASAQLRHVLADPQVDEAAKQRVLVELTRDAEPLVANTLQLLQQKGRLVVVGGLREEFEALAGIDFDRLGAESNG